MLKIPSEFKITALHTGYLHAGPPFLKNPQNKVTSEYSKSL